MTVRVIQSDLLEGIEETGMVPIASHAWWPVSGGTSDGANAAATYQAVHPLISGFEGLRLVYANVELGDVDAAFSVTLKAGVVVDGVNYVASFSAGASKVLAPGEVVFSDVIDVNGALALGSIASRSYVSVTLGQTWPTLYIGRSARNEGRVYDADRTASGAVTATDGRQFAPVMILGRPV